MELVKSGSPQPRRSLVVGASGQVGSAISALLGPALAVPASSRHCPPSGIRLDLAEVGDCPEIAVSLLGRIGVGAVYCVGGMTNVDACETDPGLAMRVNCWGPAALAGAAAAIKIRFVYFSTEYVFDGMGGPYDEESQTCPISVYGESKLRGEVEVVHAHPEALVIRTTVVYGHDPGGKNFVYSLRRALLAGRTILVPNDQFSTPTYNQDLARGAVKLLESGFSGVIHVAGAERLSRLEFAHRAAKAMHLDPGGILGVPTVALGQRARRPLQAGLDTAKLQELCPGLRMHSVEEAIDLWLGEGIPKDP